jgi:hypothetical protein
MDKWMVDGLYIAYKEDKAHNLATLFSPTSPPLFYFDWDKPYKNFILEGAQAFQIVLFMLEDVDLKNCTSYANLAECWPLGVSLSIQLKWLDCELNMVDRLLTSTSVKLDNIKKQNDMIQRTV